MNFLEEIEKGIKVCPKCQMYNCHVYEECCHSCFLKINDAILITREGELSQCSSCEVPLVEQDLCMACARETLTELANR